MKIHVAIRKVTAYKQIPLPTCAEWLAGWLVRTAYSLFLHCRMKVPLKVVALSGSEKLIRSAQPTV